MGAADYSSGTAMNDPAAGEARLEAIEDARTERRAFITAAVILLGFVLVEALSVATEIRRSGREPGLLPWVLELSSLLFDLLLLAPLLWLTRRFPWSNLTWKRLLPIYGAASVAFSAVHVGGMVMTRKLLMPVLLGRSYDFLRGPWWSEPLYEYRKDLLTFVLLSALFHLVRLIAQQDQELRSAQREAKTSRRITLKCGGSTIWVDAERFVWARAAGNYVELKADGREHLARITLGALETQLSEAGVEVVRPHRSWLTNQARIVEILPTGEGAVRIHMDDGTEVPGSRRFRHRLPAP